jgi:hypothetical protein
MPISLASYIQPRNATNADPALRNTYYMVEDVFLKGGYQVRADHADRDSINDLNRKAGMLVQTLDDGKIWTLQADLITWSELKTGGGGGSTQRTTVSYTSNSLVPGGFEDFLIPVSPSFIMYALTLSSPGELKIYGLPDRSDTNPYTFVAIDNHLTDDGTFVNTNGIRVDARRYTVLFNLEEPKSANMYFTVTNTSDVETDITATLSFLPLEQ